jgi:hypothetical protein
MNSRQVRVNNYLFNTINNFVVFLGIKLLCFGNFNYLVVVIHAGNYQMKKPQLFAQLRLFLSLLRINGSTGMNDVLQRCKII